MRRLPPVKQKNPLQCWTSRFPAPPLAYDTFRPLNSIAAVGPPCALAPPDSLVCSASLPFALTPCSARFQLESVVRALPSLSRSQSADRLSYPQTGSKAVRSRPDAAARRERLAAFPPGHTLTPLSSLSSLATLYRLQPPVALSIHCRSSLSGSWSGCLPSGKPITHTSHRSLRRAATRSLPSRPASRISIQQQRHTSKSIAQQLRRMLVQLRSH
jgi:hypothetical protein